MEIATVVAKIVAAALAGDFRTIFSVVMFLSGVACIGSLGYQFYIDSWPATAGRLLTSKLKEIGSARVVAERTYVPDVRYEYQVDGRTYVGTEITPWKVMASHNLQFVLERQLPAFRGEGVVRVIYHPRKPHRSFLRGSGWLGKLTTLILAAVFVGAAMKVAPM